MHEIETERLRLIALDLENLRLRLNDRARMERSLGLAPTSDVPDAEDEQALRRAVTGAIERMERGGSDYRWHTFWQIVNRQDSRIVGEIDFHGTPNERGDVEFGYGTRPEYRNRGYMTEAARALAAWAFTHAEVAAVIAETAKENLASQRVLQKLGAALVEETPTLFRWRLERPDVHAGVSIGATRDDRGAKMKLGNPLIYNVNEVELEERSPAWYGKPIKRKLLRKDPATGALHVLNVYPPGLNGPAHRHNCAHTMFILRGQMLINGKPYGPGTYAYFPPGELMVHTTPPDQECAFLLFFDGAPEFRIEGGKTYQIT